MRTRKPNARQQRGLTLIEIMVVVAILGMMAAAVGVYAMGQFGTAQQRTVAMDLKTLETQLDLYFVQKGHLPSQSEGLKALVNARIARELARDPWGSPYQYVVNGGEVTLSSLGSDGQPGGTESAADVVTTIRMR